MAGCGFSWCYAVVAAVTMLTFNIWDQEIIKAFLNLFYVAIIIPVLGAGLVIWADSVTTAARRKDAVSIGVASWNTFAMAHNTYEAFRGVPDALGSLGKFFEGGGSSKSKGQVMVVVLVIIIAISGFITAYAISRWSASAYAKSVLQEMRSAPA